MNVDIKNAEALAEALKARLQLVISDPANEEKQEQARTHVTELLGK